MTDQGHWEGLGLPVPCGAIALVAGPVQAGGLSESLGIDERGGLWVCEARAAHAPLLIGESALTVYREREWWILAGAYSDLPEGVRLLELDLNGTPIERIKRTEEGWIATSPATVGPGIHITWADLNGHEWQRRDAPSMEDLVTSQLTLYGPLSH